MDLLKVPKGKAKGKEAKRLVWTPEAERSFVETKKLLAQRLELFIVEPDRPFHMETDASDFAIGATSSATRTEVAQARSGPCTP